MAAGQWLGQPPAIDVILGIDALRMCAQPRFVCFCTTTAFFIFEDILCSFVLTLAAGPQT